MLSPAQRHSQRIKLQRQLDENQAIATTSDSLSLHLHVAAIEKDVRRLRDLPSTAERVEMKRDELLPRYLPSAKAYLESGEVYKNPIFSYCVIWLFDVGDYDQALDYADIAIEQGQITPDNFKSAFPAFVADTMLDWLTEEADQGNAIEPYFSRTFNNVTQKWALHEKIVAKWFKFAGLQLIRTATGEFLASGFDDIKRLELADSLLAKAQHLNKFIGVKTQRERIAARLRALTSI